MFYLTHIEIIIIIDKFYSNCGHILLRIYQYFCKQLEKLECNFVQIHENDLERFGVFTYDPVGPQSPTSTGSLSPMPRSVFFRMADFLQAIRRQKLIHMWMAATLVVWVGTGLVLRPDRDVTQYLKHQHVGTYPSDMQARQLVTHIRLLQIDGLALDQVRGRLLSNGSITNGAVNRMMELKAVINAKQQAEERLTLFAAIALAPPLIVLEFGAALIWLRGGYTGWLSAHRADPKSSKASR